MAYFVLAIPILSLGFNMLAQILVYKYLLKKKLLKSEYFGYLFGLLFLIITEAGAHTGLFREWLALCLVNLIIYTCFAYCYFTFINMGETARRVRLLRELYDCPGGLTREEIFERYNANEIIKVRLSRLINNNQIILREGRYYLGKPVMALISKSIFFLKFIVLGRNNE